MLDRQRGSDITRPFRIPGGIGDRAAGAHRGAATERLREAAALAAAVAAERAELELLELEQMRLDVERERAQLAAENERVQRRQQEQLGSGSGLRDRPARQQHPILQSQRRQR